MRKKPTITQEEYKRVQEQALAAKELLEDERFQFFRDYFQSAKTYAEESILNNTIREVREVVPLSDKLTRIFKTPKKVQIDELSGQYKLITKFFSDLTYYASLKDELEQEISNNKLILSDDL